MTPISWFFLKNNIGLKVHYFAIFGLSGVPNNVRMMFWSPFLQKKWFFTSLNHIWKKFLRKKNLNQNFPKKINIFEKKILKKSKFSQKNNLKIILFETY